MNGICPVCDGPVNHDEAHTYHEEECSWREVWAGLAPDSCFCGRECHPECCPTCQWLEGLR